MAKKKVISLKYEGISFNAENAAGKDLNQFTKENAGTGLSKEQLKEVHSLAGKAVRKTKKVVKAEESEASPEVEVKHVPGEVAEEMNKTKDQ